MKCPICPDATLLMTDRQGVEIDYCPQCRGIWLDRGELDKLIEIAAKPAPVANGYVSATPAAYPSNGHAPGYAQERRPDFQHSGHHGLQEQHYDKSKKSWLSEIFD